MQTGIFSRKLQPAVQLCSGDLQFIFFLFSGSDVLAASHKVSPPGPYGLIRPEKYQRHHLSTRSAFWCYPSHRLPQVKMYSVREPPIMCVVHSSLPVVSSQMRSVGEPLIMCVVYLPLPPFRGFSSCATKVFFPQQMHQPVGQAGNAGYASPAQPPGMSYEMPASREQAAAAVAAITARQEGEAVSQQPPP